MANLTLEDIANISFPRANFGGYRAEDVDAFIETKRTASAIPF